MAPNLLDMANHKLERIALVAEVVSAVAVVISLAYLGYEVSQNTSAVASTSYQAIHDSEDSFWQTLSSDTSTSRIWELGLKEAPSLSEAERAQFTISARRLIYLFQNVHYQRRKDVVDDELWDAWAASLDEFLTEPGFVEVIRSTKSHLSPAFVELVGSRAAAPW